MKNCPVCGAECGDNDKFCTGCGASFAAAAPAAPAAEEKPLPAENKAQALLKKNAASVVALIAAIAFTLAVIFSAAYAAAIPGLISGYADEIGDYSEELLDNINGYLASEGLEEIDDLGIDADVITEAARSAKTTLSSALKAVAVQKGAILLAAALWITWISARKSSNPGCNATGIVIVKILQILSLIGVILLIITLAALTVIITANLPENSSDAIYAIAGLLGFILLLCLLYQCGALRSLKRMKTAAKGLALKGRVSGFVAFVLFVGAILKAISGFSALAFVGFGGTAAVALACKILAIAVGRFCLGMLVKRCKPLNKLA